MSVTRRHIMTQDESLVDKAECLISLVNAAWPESVRGSLAAPRTWAGSIHTELLSGPSHELLQHELMDRFGFNQGNYFEAWIPPVGSKAREQRDFSNPPSLPTLCISLTRSVSVWKSPVTTPTTSSTKASGEWKPKAITTQTVALSIYGSLKLKQQAHYTHPITHS